MKITHKYLTLAAINTAFITASPAAILLNWSFASDASETADDVIQTDKVPKIADAFLSRGPGLNPDGNNASADGPFTSKAQGAVNEQNYSMDIATAMGNGQYVTFTVDAANGTDLFTIENVTINNFYSRSSSSEFTFHLFSSATGFNDGDQLASDVWDSVNGGNINFDATELGSTFVDMSGPLEFRILTLGNTLNYIEHGFGTKGGADDLTVTGVIPEPSSVGLILMGSLIPLAVIRRKQSKK